CHALGPAAETAPAVFFNDDAEPYVALALRLASGATASEWFWPLAIPALPRQVSRADSLRFLLFSILETSAGVAAGARLVRELVEAGTAEVLLRALRPQDGSPLLATFGWHADRVGPRSAFDGSVSSDEEQNQLLERWVGAWDVHDARSVWLACVLLVARNAAWHSDPNIEERALGWMRAVAPSFTVASEPARTRKARLREAMAQGESPILALCDRVEREEQQPRVAAEGRLMRAGAAEGRRTLVDAEPTVWFPEAVPSAYAGLVFLVPLLVRLGIEPLLASRPELIERA